MDLVTFTKKKAKREKSCIYMRLLNLLKCADNSTNWLVLYCEVSWSSLNWV